MESQVKQCTDNTKPLQNSRNGFIELCRFIFAMGIVSHHSQFLTNDLNEVPILGGYVSVEFFFILTGYFMYSSYKSLVYRTGQDRTGQDRTGQDRTGQDKECCLPDIYKN